MEHRKQSASRVELESNEEMTKKLSKKMDHSIDTHRAKYTFVNTTKEAIGAYKSLKDWREGHEKPQQSEVNGNDETHVPVKRRKWTAEETDEIEEVLSRKKMKFTKLQEVREEFKDNIVLKDRTFKNILDKIRQVQK